MLPFIDLNHWVYDERGGCHYRSGAPVHLGGDGRYYCLETTVGGVGLMCSFIDLIIRFIGSVKKWATSPATSKTIADVRMN